MTILAEHFDVVIGVDTHKHTHTFAALNSATGTHIGSITTAATPDGFTAATQQMTRLAGRDASLLWAVEGCGSWGRQLVNWLHDRNQPVVEVERPKRPKRHMGAKTDDIDAVRAARETIGADRTATPKTIADRDLLAATQTARNSAVDAATDAERQLLALLVTAPAATADQLRGLNTTQLVTELSRPRRKPGNDYETIMMLLAKRIVTLRTEADTLKQTISDLVTRTAPALLDLHGVGPITAAIVICAWGQPGRIRNEAAFAMFAGTAPIPASSGLTNRHRLNRSGDRRLNSAIHIIAVTRLRSEDRTKTYANKRKNEGKTDRDIRRCIKNYIARELYKTLEQTH
jgi:transposase